MRKRRGTRRVPQLLVDAVWARRVVAELDRARLPAAELLSAVGLRSEQLIGPDARIPFDAHVMLLENAARAYYTVERDGFRVVATLAQGEFGAPVRFEAVLLPGQSVVLSTIRVVDAEPVLVAVEVSREGDRVLLHDAPAPSWDEVVVLDDAPATN